MLIQMYRFLFANIRPFTLNFYYNNVYNSEKRGNRISHYADVPNKSTRWPSFSWCFLVFMVWFSPAETDARSKQSGCMGVCVRAMKCQIFRPLRAISVAKNYSYNLPIIWVFFLLLGYIILWGSHIKLVCDNFEFYFLRLGNLKLMLLRSFFFRLRQEFFCFVSMPLCLCVNPSNYFSVYRFWETKLVMFIIFCLIRCAITLPTLLRLCVCVYVKISIFFSRFCLYRDAKCALFCFFII